MEIVATGLDDIVNAKLLGIYLRNSCVIPCDISLNEEKFKYKITIHEIDLDYLITIIDSWKIQTAFDVRGYISVLKESRNQKITKIVDRYAISECSRSKFFLVGGIAPNMGFIHNKVIKRVRGYGNVSKLKVHHHDTVISVVDSINGDDMFMGGSPQDVILRMGFRRHFEVWGKCKVCSDKPNDIARGLSATKEQIASIGGLIGNFNHKHKIKKNQQGEWTPIDISKIYPEIPLLSSEAVAIIKNRARQLAKKP